MNLNQIQSTVRKKKIASVIGSVVGDAQPLSEVLKIGNDGGGKQIKNIADPTDAQDALTLAYFNAHSGSGSISSVSGTANQITANTVAGAVTLSLPSSVVFPGTWSIGTLGFTDTNILFSAQSSVNSYNQSIIQNSSNGSSASANYIVNNDQGSAGSNYGEFGINSSAFSGSGSWNIAGAVYLDAASSDLSMGTLSNKAVHVFVNGNTTDSMQISGAGVFTFNAPIPSNTFSSTWTATSNNQSAWVFNGTVTSENTASDTFRYMEISPTLTRNAGNPASQIATALLLNPTFSNSPATKYILRMQSGSSDVATFSDTGAIVLSASTANISSTVAGLTLFTNVAGLSLVLQTLGDANSNQGVRLQASATITSGQNRAISTVVGTFQQSGASGNNHYGINNTLTANYTSVSDQLLHFYNASLTVTAIQSTNTVYGYRSQIPSGTGTRWNFYADGNANNAFAGLNSFGKVTTPAAFVDLAAGTTSNAPLNITEGVAPTSPSAGNIWTETTNHRLMWRQNATSVELIGTSSVNSVSPTAQNRTVTVVINGTTYYLTAKTTND
jgi:hypothetical protein